MVLKMNKKARQLLVTIFVISIVCVLIFTILLTSGLAGNIKDSKTSNITYGYNWQDINNAGSHTVTIYGTPVFLDKFVNVTESGDNILIKYNNKEVNIKLKIVDKSGKEKDLKEVKELNSNIEYTKNISKNNDEYEFSWNIKDSKNNKLDISSFYIENDKNLNISEDGTTIYLGDNLIVNLQDLIDTGYILTKEKDRVKITADISKGKSLDTSELLLDPTVSTMTIGKDTYIRNSTSGYENTNYGYDSSLTLQNSNPTYRSLLQITTVNIPDNSTITNAYINMRGESSYTNKVARIYRITNYWMEGTGNGNTNSLTYNGTTWRERWYSNNVYEGCATDSVDWCSKGGDYDSTVLDTQTFPNAVDSRVNFTVTSAVQGFVNGSYSNYGFMLDTTSTSAWSIYSLNSIVDANHPYMVITYIEPQPILSLAPANNTKQTSKTVNFQINATITNTNTNISQIDFSIFSCPDYQYSGLNNCIDSEFFWLGYSKYYAGTTIPADGHCYQETTNATSSAVDGICGLDYSGSYKTDSSGSAVQLSYLFDGDWDTYSSPAVTYNNWTIVYKKPLDANTTSFWRVKDTNATEDLTIPFSCWNYSSTNLTFKTYFMDSTNNNITWYCYNGTYVSLRSVQKNVGWYPYEEAMIWYLDDFTRESKSISYTRQFNFTDDGVYNFYYGGYTSLESARYYTQAWSPSDYIVIIDSSSPNVTFQSPTPAASSTKIANSVVINVTAEDFSGVDTCTLQVNNTATITNYTMTKNNKYCNYTLATVDGTQYWIKVFANDTSNRIGNTSTRYFVEDAPPTAPTSITCVPSSPYTNSTINCTATGSLDMYGNPIDQGSYYYEWYYNNSMILTTYGWPEEPSPVFNCSSTYYANICTPGKVLYISSWTYDGYLYSAKNTTNITFLNFIPVVNSSKVSNSTWSDTTNTNINLYENNTNGTYVFNITSITDIDVYSNVLLAQTMSYTGTGSYRLVGQNFTIDSSAKITGFVFAIENRTSGVTINVTIYNNISKNTIYGSSNNINLNVYNAISTKTNINLTTPVTLSAGTYYFEIMSNKDNSLLYYLNEMTDSLPNWGIYDKVNIGDSYSPSWADLWFIIIGDYETHWYDWFIDGVKVTVSASQSFFSWILGSVSVGPSNPHNVTAVVNDSSNAVGTKYWNVTVYDTNKPSLTLAKPTSGAWYNYNTSLSLNFTYSDVHPGTCWYNINNGTNTTISCLSNSTFNVSEGSKVLYFYSNDTSNNINSTSVAFNVDVTNPLVRIFYPTNTSYSTSVTAINFSASDTNINTCWYSTNGGVTNTTTSCTANVTGRTSNQGSNTWLIGVNDSAGNKNSTSITFFLDSVYPTINYTSPTPNNNTYQTATSFVVNYTGTEVNLQAGWITMNNVNYTATCTGTSPYYCNKTFSALADGIYNYTAFLNDTLGNTNSTEQRIVTVDTTYPTIDWGSSTYADGENKSDNAVRINVTWTETNFKNITFRINSYSSTQTTPTYYYTYMPGVDGVYYYNVTICDYANLCNITSTRKLTLDTNNPSATLTSPANNSYNNTDQNYSATLSDNLGIKNATLNIINSTNSTINQTTISYAPGTVTSTIGIVVTLVDGVYRWFYSLFDWAGNSYSASNYTITIDKTIPLINIVTPANNTNTTSTQLNINYTISDTNTLTCKYTRNAGVSNTTLSGCGNITAVTWNEGINNITIYATDPAGNSNSSSVTFRLDTTKPAVTIAYPTNNLVLRDLYTYNLSLNLTATDSGVGIQAYKYSLNGAANVTFTPNTSIIGIAGQNNISVSVNDSLGNTNTTLITFNLTFTPKINDINISNASTSYDRNQNTSVTDGLVGWWKLDRNSTTQIDSTGITENGSVNGNASFNNNGKIGGAYTFYDNKSYINLGHNAKYQILNSTNFSVSLWFMKFGSSLVSDSGGLFTKYQASNNAREYFFAVSNAGKVYLTTFPNATVGTGYTLNSASTITNNIWYMTTLVIFPINSTSLNVTIYINGNLDSSTLLAAPCTMLGASGLTCTGLTNTYLGAIVSSSNTPDRVLNGTIDEVRLYNRTLTSSEIYNLYSITNPVFQEYANVTINTTITDEDTPDSSLYYSWLVNGVSVLTGFAQSVLNWIFVSPTNAVQVNVNDTYNYQVTQNWTVNTTFVNPTINFTSPTPNNNTYLNTNTFVVNFTGTEVNLNSGWVVLNNVNYTATCVGTSPYYCNKTFSGLANGIYNYTAWVNDKVNNQNSTEARRITIDTISPSLNITYPLNTTYAINVSALNYTIVEVNPVSCWYSNNSGVWNSSIVTAGTNFTSVTSIEGSNTWTVYCNDSAGNINSTSRTFFKDTVYPTIDWGTNIAVDGANLSQTNIFFNVTYNESNFNQIQYFRATYPTACLSGSVYTTFTATETTYNSTGLANGTYNYCARIYDVALNVNVTSTRTITLDTGIPSATLIYPTNNTYNSTTTQNYSASLTDNLGIKNATLNIINSTDGIVNQTTISYAPSTVTATIGIVVTLVDGAYKWFYKLFDWAGNSYTTNNNTITIDTINPTISFALPTPLNNSNTSSSTISFNITGTEVNVNNSWLQINSTTNYTMTCVGTSTYYCNLTVTLPDKVYNFTAYILDKVGKINYTSQRTFRIDTTPPNTVATGRSPPGGATYTFGTWTKNNVGMTFSITDSGVGVDDTYYPLYCTDTTNTCTPSTPAYSGFTVSTVNTSYVRYFSVDYLGNTEGTLSKTIMIDNIQPAVTIRYPTNNMNFSYNTSIPLNYSVSDSLSGLGSCWYNIDNGTNTTIAGCSNTTFNSPEGSHTLYLYVNDTVNNINSTSVVYRVDMTSPTITIAYPTATNYRDVYNYSIELNITIADSGVGESSRWWTINGGLTNTTFTGNTTVTGLTNNSNTIKVYSNDTLNNINNASITFNLTFTPKINDITISNSTTSYERNSLLDGLIGWWKMDEINNNQKDSSGYATNLTLVGNNITSGKIGNAVYLNGSGEYLTSSASDIYNSSLSFSVSMWIKPPAVDCDSNNNWRNLIRVSSSVSSSTYGWDVIWEQEQVPQFDIGNGTTSNRLKSGYTNNNTWTFYVFRYDWDNNITSIYKDGVWQANKTISGKINYGSTNTLRIGQGSSALACPNGNGYMTGYIDEVRLYNRTLSPTEIYQLYSITNPTFQEYANVTINATITDEDTPQSSLYYSWFVDGVSVLTGFANNVLNYIFGRPSTQVNVVVNDTNGYNVNQTWNVTTTFINPTINFTSPTPTNNTYQNSNTFIVNFTGNESNINRGWVNMNNVNYTATCVGSSPYYCNKTFTSLADGIYNYQAFVNDTVGNQNNTELRMLTVDTTYPLISYGVGTQNNGVNLSQSNIYINTTFTETNLRNITYNLYNLTSLVNSTAYTTAIYFINFTNLPDTTYYYNVTIIDLVNLANTTSTYKITLDTVNPLISYGVGTLANGINISQSNIYINTTFTELNFKNITYTIKNLTDIVNITTYTTPVYTFNITNLSDTTYTYWANITDIAGNKNSTTAYTITLDIHAPNVTLLSPVDSYTTRNSTNNYTANLSDNLGIKNATLFIYNETNNLINQTTINYIPNTVTNVVGIVVTLVDGIYHWFYDAFDWAGNYFVSPSNNTITIDSTNPQLTILYPTGIQRNSTTNQLNINYSVSDLHLDTCKYTTNNGVTNTTLPSCNNITTLTWNQGSTSIIIYVNDTFGNTNSSSVDIFVDSIVPTLNIIAPEDGETFTKITIPFNFTASDSGIGLSSCWWRNDTDANNISIACNSNITFTQGAGAHTLYLWANDSFNNVNNVTVSYSISLDKPSINLVQPSENSWLNNGTNVDFIFTAQDPNNNGILNCSLIGNWTGNWEINQSNTTLILTPGGEVINYNFKVNLTDGYYKWNAMCFESTGSFSGLSIINKTFGIDTLTPQISFDTTTSDTGTNYSRTWLYAGVNIAEYNFKNITYNLYNSLHSLVNSTYYTTLTNYINWTGLSDDVYYYNVTLYDLAGNVNYTETRQIRLDATAPVLTIYSPLSTNYANNNTIELNISSVDAGIGVNDCWYNVYNSSFDFLVTTTTIPSCSNTTFELPGGDIDYVLRVYSRDLLNNVRTSTVNFGIRTVKPAIQLYNTYSDRLTNNYFNFSVNSNNDISQCDLYTNFTGTWLVNQTIYNPTKGVVLNFSAVDLNEGSYIWNVWCNDSLNNNDYSLTNNTYIVDVTYPIVNITNILGLAGSQTITYYYSYTEIHPSTCKYSIFNLSGSIDGTNENVSIPSCATSGTATVTVPASTSPSFYLYVYVKDLSGNENYTNSGFTLTPLGATITGGGGGGAPPAASNKTRQWTMTSEASTKSYNFQLIKGSSRTRDIYFTNKGTKVQDIKLSCNGSLCSYLTFQNTSLQLPIAQDIITRLSFSLNIPDNISNGNYIVNIKGTDQDKLEDILTLDVNVGIIGTPIELIDKLTTTKSIYGIPIPYFLFSLLAAAIVFILCNYLIFRKLRIGIAISIVMAFIAGVAILLII